MKRLSVLTIACVLLSCSGKQPTQDTTPKPRVVSVDGHDRLTDAVVPTRYRLDLTIRPAAESFEGKAVIEVDIKESTDTIVLHAEDLEFDTVGFERGKTMISPDAQLGKNGGLALVFEQPVEPGPASLVFRYRAPLDEVPTGLYRVKEGEAWYAFTQFEPLEAREAFPSFDEPRFKTPYKVTMRVPTGQLGVTNTPEVNRTTIDDLDVFEFQESKPLPTYLVAFAVGDFDVVEAPSDAIEGVPLRLLATKGKGELGAFMLKRIPALLQALTDYFGTPYPYAKLDVIAVPNFSAGAMENVGLVTFRERLLLLDNKTASVSDRRSAMSVMAHELAHMWFGNSVTLPWWNDLWLNESFATWMAHRVITELLPELGSSVDAILSVNWIIGADSRKESRMIRQPIESGGDVYNAFDGITYGKGAAMLRMFEAWAGAEGFRDGVRAYLKANEHGTGTTEGLLSALDESTGKPVGEAMATFLDQPGAPLLTVNLDCEGDAPKLIVEQERYLPAGSAAPETGPWHVPFCVTYRDRRETKQICELLTEPKGEFALDAKRCPSWYYPNADQAGYYRWNTSDENLAEITSGRTFRSFDDPTKIEIFTNLESLSVAEKIPVDRWFETIETMSKEKHRNIVRQVIGALSEIENAVPDDKRKRFEARARELLRPHMKRVGYLPEEGEPLETSLLRPRLFRASVKLAGDADGMQAANRKTQEFLKDMSSVQSDVAGVALPISAWFGDPSLWLSYKLSLENAPTPAARVAVIRGLGSFRGADLLQKSLGLFLDGTLRAQDMWTVIGPSYGQPETFEVTWAWFTENFDAIVAKLGDESLPRMPGVGSGFCSPEGRKKVESFFAEPGRTAPGSERNLSQTLERIEQCIRRKQYYGVGMEAFLK